jgi:hypothetical protein
MTARLPSLLLACLGLAGAAEDGGGAPALDPTPVVVPMRPQSADPADADPDARLRRRLADLVVERERRIAELARAREGRPAAAPAHVAGLDAPRRERDEALARARAGAQELVAKTRAARGDTLDVAAPAQVQEQGATLGAGNQLAIAECYRRLVAEQDGGAADLVAGQAALDRVDAAKLVAADLPRMLYLRVWFLAERARRSDSPEERSRLVAAAREVQRDLLRDWPKSELAHTAQRLVLDLDQEPQ